MTARTDAAGRHERIAATVLEIDVDTCSRTYGVAPCAAAAGTGNECYNTFGTCQDKTNYGRTTRTIKFCSRGMAAPAGETIRPYILDVNATPTEIAADKGLAVRGQTSVTLVDETCRDLDDPYIATRAAASGTFWGRFAARNYNVVGRFARVRRGFVVSPFDWSTFQSELYVVTDFGGPDRQGRVRLTLSDPVAKLDAVKIPKATDGKLDAVLYGVTHSGVATAGASTTITLPSTGSGAASAVDDFYNGQEIYITANTGAGQRRTISDYVGATRVATVSVAWSVNPDSTSGYEISPLSLTLATGKGTQYTDPATSGKPEYVRIGDEVLRYTAKSGDVLSWPDTTYRGQFGTTREQAAANAVVQLCRAYSARTVAQIVEDIITEGGLASSYIDTAGLSAESTQWYSGVTLTACITAPESAASLLADLSVDLNAALWWDAVAQKVKFKANMPEVTVSGSLDDSAFIAGSVDVKRDTKSRITQAAIYYDPRTATSDMKKAPTFGRAALYVDTDAESANEYGDQKPLIRYSRWLSAGNENYAAAWVARALGRRRDPPVLYAFKLDPRDEVSLGSLITLTTSSVQSETGAAASRIARITKVEDVGDGQQVAAVSTNFSARYGFIAPNGYPNYTAASEAQKAYAFISTTSTGKMSNGDAGYRII